MRIFSVKRIIALCCIVIAQSFHPAFATDFPKPEDWNNDRVMAVQQFGGVRKSTGNVTLTYYGFMAFKITTPRGLEIFIDPWGNDPNMPEGVYWYQRRLPKVRTDIALVTHPHFDHDAIDRLDATMILNRMAGQFELGDVKITGIAEKHMCETQGKYAYRSMVVDITGKDPCPPKESYVWDNNMFIIETGGLRILHWGDNRQNPPEDVWRKIGKVDVAILPVSDDGHILSPKWADVVMKKLDARIVIPGHYYIDKMVVPNAGGLETADGWVNSHEHTLLDNATLTLTPEMAHGYKQHVMYFSDHVAFPLVEKFQLPPQKEMPPVPAPAEDLSRFKN